jgi:hypothetical protein
MKGIRVTSLCFYYLYVDVNPSNLVKTQGSDIIDIYHFCLLPYSRYFTVDKSMKRILKRVAKEIDISNCIILTPESLK